MRYLAPSAWRQHVLLPPSPSLEKAALPEALHGVPVRHHALAHGVKEL
jgi:hypothetical protein